AARHEEPGFDPRLLLKVEVVGASPEDFEAIGGLRVVSQEARSLVLLFATEAGLADFRHRLDQVAAGRRPTRQDLLFAVKGVSGWTRADRTGPALGREGVPPDGAFLVDVELWPLEQGRERAQMLGHFDRWCEEHGVAILDKVNQRAVILKRLRLESGPLGRLLELRDVRLVDLPPRYQLDVRLTHLPLATIGEVPPPPEDAEGVAVLDSGIAANHPVLGPAVGDAQSFLPELGPEDECGHGTMVAGLALYGDVATRAETGRFVPELRLFSGRICDARNENDTGFVENHVVEAVRYFREHYGCRVFNLSFGDLRRPYTGGHVRGLAAILDSLAREQGVLFTVAAGNFAGSDEGPTDWRREYPEYLLHEDARLIDPAPALNVLTVGSLARYEVPRMGQRFPHDVGYQAIARADAPSPFSRSGPGPGGAIKPDVAEYGGNWHVEARARPDTARGSSDLGELSTWHAFVGGNLFGQDSGTSFAAPRVAHGAPHVFRLYPDASPDLVRALIVAHARQPPAALDAVGHDRAKALRLIGYGAPDWDAVRYS
ncbi:MAG: S8 family peptidase, partial [Proteobacteria bacterium]|nr:S8 family peptidase [Pseudomonadota bacterium]